MEYSLMTETNLRIGYLGTSPIHIFNFRFFMLYNFGVELSDPPESTRFLLEEQKFSQECW